MTLDAAALSWNFVKDPRQRPARKIRWPTMLAVVVGLLATGLVVSLAAHGKKPNRAIAQPAVNDIVHSTLGPGPQLPAATVAGPAVAIPPPHRAHDPARPLRVLLVGDSVAETLGQGLSPAAGPAHIDLINRGVLGCGVVRGGPYRYFGGTYQPIPRCENWPGTWQAEVSALNPDVVAILVGRWELMDRMHDGHWTHVGDPAFDAYLATELDTAIGVASARGAQVALLTAPYFHRGARPDGGSWPEDDPARVGQWNTVVRQVAARHPGTVQVIDFGGRLSPGNTLATFIDGVRVRSDGVHLTPEGGHWIAPWLLAQITAISNNPPTG